MDIELNQLEGKIKKLIEINFNLKKEITSLKEKDQNSTIEIQKLERRIREATQKIENLLGQIPQDSLL
ncbi:MAG: hypothetical protein VW238_03850 [Nitrosomonadales bacterium]|jgi:FtsZ-binding cell division protein ZapB